MTYNPTKCVSAMNAVDPGLRIVPLLSRAARADEDYLCEVIIHAFELLAGC
jgi:hypothetical protein